MTELLLRRFEEDIDSAITADVYHPSRWESVQHDLLRLTQLGMDEGVIQSDDVNDWSCIHFQKEDPDMINVVLMKGKKAIGFSTAYRYPDPSMAIINHTIIAAEARHLGYVRLINRQMDSTLKARGVKVVERYALKGYDTVLARAYKDNIVDTKVYPSSTYFKMKL